MNEEQFEFMICGWQSSSQGWIMLRQYLPMSYFSACPRGEREERRLFS